MVRLESAESTNDVAAALAAAGWPAGTVVVAGAQRAGRGSQGRAWHSPPGANLYCSVVLRPWRRLREWPELSWVIAAAVAECARAAGAAGAVVKDPNDVVVGGRKLAGVLLETRTLGAEPAALVAGVGINVNATAEDFPDALRTSAVSLAQLTGSRHDCADLLTALCGAMERWCLLWADAGGPAVRSRLERAGLSRGAEGEAEQCC